MGETAWEGGRILPETKITMNRMMSKLLAVVVLTFAAGAGSARAADGIYIKSIYQNGNNVIVKYHIPNNTPAFSLSQTRWNGPGSNSSNEYQQTWKLGYHTVYNYTIPNIQSHQRYVFKVQAYAGSWTKWNERYFTTKDVTYHGYLYQRK